MDSLSTRQLTSEECDFVSGGGIPVPAPRPDLPDCTCSPPPQPAKP